MDGFGTKPRSLKPNRVVYQNSCNYTWFDLERQKVVELEARVLVRKQDTFYIIDCHTPLIAPSCVVLIVVSITRDVEQKWLLSSFFFSLDIR